MIGSCMLGRPTITFFYILCLEKNGSLIIERQTWRKNYLHKLCIQNINIQFSLFDICKQNGVLGMLKDHISRNNTQEDSFIFCMLILCQLTRHPLLPDAIYIVDSNKDNSYVVSHVTFTNN